MKIATIKEDKDSLAEIREEFAFRSRLASANLVAYLNLYFFDNQVYIVSEYIAGVNLSDYVRFCIDACFFDETTTNSMLVQLEEGPIANESQIAAILREILWGLSFLHLAKHFHCDVKPSRVHFSIEGSVKLAGRGLPPSYKARRSSALGLRMSVIYTHMPLTLI